MKPVQQFWLPPWLRAVVFQFQPQRLRQSPLAALIRQPLSVTMLFELT